MEGSYNNTFNDGRSHIMAPFNAMTNKPSLKSQLLVGGARSRDHKEKDRLFAKRPKLLSEVAENHTLTNVFFRPIAKRY